MHRDFHYDFYGSPAMSQSQSYDESTGELDADVLNVLAMGTCTFMNTGNYSIAHTALQSRSISVVP